MYYLTLALTLASWVGLAQGDQASSCTFPAYLRARPRWEAEVSVERQVIGTVWAFNDHSVETGDRLGPGEPVTTYDCYRQDAPDKFVVKLRSDSKEQVFTCLKFIQRSAYVTQVMRSKTPMNSDNPDLCLEINMMTDSSPLLWPIPEEYIQTPALFVGGFQFTLADHASGFNLCQTAELLPLFEANCMADDGISVDFRQFSCRGDLGMEIVQKLYVLGSWEQGTYIYTIVTDLSELWPRLWLLRAPANPPNPDAFDVDIFTSISINSGPINSDSSAHYTMQMKRASYKSICTDEARYCTQCENNSQNVNCLQTCQSEECLKLATQAPCHFPANMTNNWLEFSANGQRSINISSQLISVESQKPRSCLDLKTEIFFEGVNRRTLVTLYENGCRPRYQCSEFNRRSDSVLQFQLSDVTVWPQALPLNPADLCAKEKFDVLKRSVIQEELHPFRWRALLKADSSSWTAVSCGLTGRFYLMASTSSGETCLANINACQGNTKMFSYQAADQCTASISTSHVCLASFKNEQNGDTIIITRSVKSVSSGTDGTVIADPFDDSTALLCWVFHKGEWDPAPKLYLTQASDCHTEIANDIAYRNFTGYIAQFDISAGSGPLGSSNCNANADNPFSESTKPSSATLSGPENTSDMSSRCKVSVLIILLAFIICNLLVTHTN